MSWSWRHGWDRFLCAAECDLCGWVVYQTCFGWFTYWCLVGNFREWSIITINFNPSNPQSHPFPTFSTSQFMSCGLIFQVLILLVMLSSALCSSTCRTGAPQVSHQLVGVIFTPTCVTVCDQEIANELDHLLAWQLCWLVGEEPIHAMWGPQDS